jgi:hypothetical protein
VPVVRKILDVPGESNPYNSDKPFKNAETVQDEKLIEANQKHDLLMEFRCPDKWLIRMSWKPTMYEDWEIKNNLR